MIPHSHITKLFLAALFITSAVAEAKPVKVFILAGDENCLEQGVVAARTDGSEAMFFLTAAPAKDEQGQVVHYAIYKGAYTTGTDFAKLTPEATGVVAAGQARGKKRTGPPMVLPGLALDDGHTTVVRGHVSVMRSGQYEVLPQDGDAAFNVTTVEGQEVYRRNVGQPTATITAVPLAAKKRHAFETIFFKKPGTDFRVPRVNIPGALETVVSGKKPYAHLQDAAGQWVRRDDVVLYDAHPIHNETRAAGRPLTVSNGGKGPQVGPELMLGHVLGNHFTDPVFLLRFATSQQVGFTRGSRTLGHDYLSPSGGGDPALAGNWDVIHFNWGIWDTYRVDRTTGKMTTAKENVRSMVPIDEYEKNLRKIVARMKQTGATLIWASITPLHKDCPTSFVGDEIKYNAVAARIMQEHGVIIDDLNAESLRQGFPKGPDVHSVGTLAPHVTKTILAALVDRKQSTKPLPRVLMIGDSITGSYLKEVTKNLDGKAVVCKNPGNGEHTGTGVARIEDWLNLKTHLQSGQEYLELINGVKDSLAQLPRFYPGYQNQGFELAGAVWFQGIADSQSPAHSAAYEKNLANLIRDLRRDLKTPALPVVVAAVGFSDGKVRDAQLAIGDPAKYPEFAGNLKSVDTRPFVRPADQSPGGYSFYYDANAESYLEIGEAMGRGMIELLDAE